MTRDAKPKEKLFDILSRIKGTRVSAVEKAGYVRDKNLQLFFGGGGGGGGGVQRISALNCVEEKTIAKWG